MSPVEIWSQGTRLKHDFATKILIPGGLLPGEGPLFSSVRSSVRVEAGLQASGAGH